MQGDPVHEGIVLDGRYRVLKQLGQGGMGTVYAAEHVGLGQRRAVKFLHRELGQKPGALRRFLQEARVLSGLKHPNLVSVIDVGEYAGTAYYVMEFLDGEDLRARMRRVGAMPWSEVRDVALQICRALHEAHARGIIHRDLKPENCFCIPEPPGTVTIKLIDFGVAKVPKDVGGTSQLTGTDETLGTVGYMAPEQLDGRGDLRVDVYSLGVMIFEMITGRAMYRGNAYEVIARMLRGSPPRLRELCAEVAPEIDELVSRTTKHDPNQRFSSIVELGESIARIPADAPPTRSVDPRAAGCSAHVEVNGEATTLRCSAAHLDPRAFVRTVAPPPAARPALARSRGWLLAGVVFLGVSAVAVFSSTAHRFFPKDSDSDKFGPPPVSIQDPPRASPGAPVLMGSRELSPEHFAPSTLVVQEQSEPLADTSDMQLDAPALRFVGPTVEGQLTRDELRRRIQREVRNCRPEILDESVTLRVVPGKSGQPAKITLVQGGQLAPGIEQCVEKGLARVERGSGELAPKSPFELAVVLRHAR